MSYLDPVRISETREVRIELPDRPLLTTPAGNAPIGVEYLTIRYDLLAGELSWVGCRGRYVNQADLDRQERGGRTSGNGGSFIDRHVMALGWQERGLAAHAPNWLRELVDQYHPANMNPRGDLDVIR